MSSRPSGRTSAVTVISFRVSVPVLSLQMTVVEPSVSTADSRRTTAPRRAMRWTPTASAIVIATGQPLGDHPDDLADADHHDLSERHAAQQADRVDEDEHRPRRRR